MQTSRPFCVVFDRSMPTSCVVPGCKNSGYKSKTSDAIGVSYHQVPGDELKRQRWSDALGLASLTSSSRVCSEHFVSGDYVRSFKSLRRLKKNAVPQRLESAQLRLQNCQGASTAIWLCQHCSSSGQTIIRHSGCQVDKYVLPSKSTQKDIPLKWDACTQTPAFIRHCGIQANLDEAAVGPKPPFIVRACAACTT